jgi:hypothetical protein
MLENQYYQRLAEYLGYESLNPEQKIWLKSVVVSRNDLYNQAPTNHGKSIVAVGAAFASEKGIFSSDPKAKFLTVLVVPSKVSNLWIV